MNKNKLYINGMDQAHELLQLIERNNINIKENRNRTYTQAFKEDKLKEVLLRKIQLEEVANEGDSPAKLTGQDKRIQ